MQILETRSFPTTQNPAFSRSVRLWPLLLFIAAVCAVSIFYVWARTQVIQQEYEISALESEVRELAKEQRVLALELESLENPARIERLARRELGMRNPEARQVVIVR